MKLRDCSKILVILKLVYLPLHLNAISTRAFILQKSAGKKMELFAIFISLERRIVNILFPLKKLQNPNKNPAALVLNETVIFDNWLLMRMAKRLFSSPD